MQCCISCVSSLCATFPLQVQDIPVVYLNISGATAGTVGGSYLSYLQTASTRLCDPSTSGLSSVFSDFVTTFSQRDKILTAVIEVFQKCWNR